MNYHVHFMNVNWDSCPKMWEIRAVRIFRTRFVSTLAPEAGLIIDEYGPDLCGLTA